MSSPGDWRGLLYVLNRKLEYNMGFMLGFADHAGSEHDANRMQLRLYPCKARNLGTKRRPILEWCDNER